MNLRDLSIDPRTDMNLYQVHEDLYISCSEEVRHIVILCRQNGYFNRIITDYLIYPCTNIIVLNTIQVITISNKEDFAKYALIRIRRDGTQHMVFGKDKHPTVFIIYLEGDHAYNEYYLIDREIINGSAPRIIKANLQGHSLCIVPSLPFTTHDVVNHKTLGLVSANGAKMENALQEIHLVKCMKYGTKYYVSAIFLDTYYLGSREGSGRECQINVYRSSGEIFRSFLIRLDHILYADSILIYGRFAYVSFDGFIGSSKLFFSRFSQVYCVDLANAFPIKKTYCWRQEIVPPAKEPKYCGKLIEDQYKMSTYVKMERNILVRIGYNKFYTMDYFEVLPRHLHELPSVVKREARALLLCWHKNSYLSRLPIEIIYMIIYYLI